MKTGITHIVFRFSILDWLLLSCEDLVLNDLCLWWSTVFIICRRKGCETVIIVKLWVINIINCCLVCYKILAHCWVCTRSVHVNRLWWCLIETRWLNWITLNHHSKTIVASNYVWSVIIWGHRHYETVWWLRIIIISLSNTYIRHVLLAKLWFRCRIYSNDIWIDFTVSGFFIHEWTSVIVVICVSNERWTWSVVFNHHSCTTSCLLMRFGIIKTLEVASCSINYHDVCILKWTTSQNSSWSQFWYHISLLSVDSWWWLHLFLSLLFVFLNCTC